MIHQVYAVYDSKTKIYSFPFMIVNRETAIRAFGNAANDRNCDVGRYPHDHALFYLGVFDDATGKYGTDAPEHVVSAHELVSEDE